MNTPLSRHALVASLIATAALQAHADTVTDWNLRANALLADSQLGTPPAIRAMAIVQTAVHQAIDGLPPRVASTKPAVDAAVAVAHRTTLTQLLPGQRAGIDAAVQAALSAIPEGPTKAAGMAAGERAATAVLAARAGDGAGAPESYRPHAAAGAYVPTALPAVPQWAQRKPWLMSGAAQFRPGPPPSLTSDQWARDYNEVKSLGERSGGRRSAEQTDAARFWAYSMPAIYHGVVRSAVDQPGRDPARNARLFAAVAQAMDDAVIGVIDAKYHHHFWRPVTAIRNGDTDGHAATERVAGWAPLVDTPMHPEYPSAHSSLASAVGTVLDAEFGAGTVPLLSTTSPSAKGAMRQWKRTDDLIREVSEARIHGGLHYRFSTDAGETLGRQVGRLAVEQLLREAP